MTSVPCWAMLIATLGNNWAFYMILTELPIYMKNILHFNTKAVSYFMSKVVQIIKYDRDFE